jgi:thiamine pyrophosphokinase
MKAAIISNGDIGHGEKLKSKLPEFDMVICCDGGIRHLSVLGLEPDLIVGDFDSVDHALLDKYKRKGVPVKSFPAIKNETDTELAVNTAIELRANQVSLIGAIGSRWDHSYANVMLLVKLAKLNISAEILHSHNHISVTDEKFSFSSDPGQIISLLPLGENVIIHSVKGLQYPIDNQEMPLDTPYGISNIFLEENVEIVIKSGWLMAVLTED